MKVTTSYIGESHPSSHPTLPTLQTVNFLVVYLYKQIIVVPGRSAGKGFTVAVPPLTYLRLCHVSGNSRTQSHLAHSSYAFELGQVPGACRTFTVALIDPPTFTFRVTVQGTTLTMGKPDPWMK